MTDLDRILDDVAAGRSDAFRHVVRAYGLPLRSFLASQVHHLDDADDLAQETFVSAFRMLSSYRRGEEFGAWLRGIARNKLKTFWRSRARLEDALGRFREEAARIVEADLERAVQDDRPETVEVLLRCIAKLPEKLRRVVRAGLEGGRAAALAEELSTSVGAVYTLHYRAGQLLRECARQELGRG